MTIGVVRAPHLPAISRAPQQDLLATAFRWWNSRFALGPFRPRRGLADTTDVRHKCDCPDEENVRLSSAWRIPILRPAKWTTWSSEQEKSLEIPMAWNDRCYIQKILRCIRTSESSVLFEWADRCSIQFFDRHLMLFDVPIQIPNLANLRVRFRGCQYLICSLSYP
jgi:hypothetical protein